MTNQPIAFPDEATLRRRLTMRWALLLVLSGLFGFVVGLVLNLSGRVLSGVLMAAFLIVVVAVTSCVVLCRERRRAGRHGLSLSRYSYVGTQISSGRLPADPALRSAALDIVERQSQAVDRASSRPQKVLRVVMIVLFATLAVDRMLSQEYGVAALFSFTLVCSLWTPLGLRRQRRRLETVRSTLDGQGSTR
ncbi:hypothetical protein G3I40_37545 [Streptomyces sp. SID14478]|uniref:hypothetical protein n=1 Tax=Streptomyces sp. SID14478 TaxID=2706073 RepID=UPI0013DE9092|nr:hypothetical protein [Streptomyces sp. SID14478]NEB80875.1 hypothetical protein [Streptomyces sp. SID14478]